MFAGLKKRLRFVFYTLMTTTHPYDFGTIPPQNTIIFEPEIDLRRSTRSQPAGTYLGDILKYCPHGSGEAVVTKMEYRKMGPRNACHEFLVCYVEDRRKIHGRVAVIRIEHCGVVNPTQIPQGESRSSLTSMSSSSSDSFFGIGAQDRFTIRCVPEIEPTDSRLLSTLYFRGPSLMVEELAVATRVASEASERYHVITNQCLWFALLIWNIICQVKAGEFREVAVDKNGMGTFSGIPLLHEDASSIFWFSSPNKLPTIISTYKAQWKKWVLDIEAKKVEKEAPAKEILTVRQEVEAMRQEVKAVRQEAEAVRQEKLRIFERIAKNESQREENRRESEERQKEIERQRLEIERQREEILELRALRKPAV
ncbi:hypothetical protein EDD85DRAFT_1023855 [Armillaria nabsnona]|nr:hypothetical protein EDD85DRAFT_1023855 [Armillaria nabsnona]